MIHPIFIAMPTDTTIWLIEDEAAIADTLTYALQTEGYAVRWFERGQLMLDALAHTQPALLILDIGLPDINGFEVCRQVLARYDLPLLFLTARAEEVDRIVGLEMGADDYLAKPANPRELLARVRSVLRRIRGGERAARTVQQGQDGREQLCFARWRLDPVARTLFDPEGVAIELSDGEFRLLLAFVEHPRRVLSRDQLLDISRGVNAEHFDRAIDVQVSRLRKKLAAAGGGDLIRTVRNEGYMFTADVHRG